MWQQVSTSVRVSAEKAIARIRNSRNNGICIQETQLIASWADSPGQIAVAWISPVCGCGWPRWGIELIAVMSLF